MFKNQEKGQGLIEYALILALVAILVVLAVILFPIINGNKTHMYPEGNELVITASGGTNGNTQLSFVVNNQQVTVPAYNTFWIYDIEDGRQEYYEPAGWAYLTSGKLHLWKSKKP